jgi:hypothetical protein
MRSKGDRSAGRPTTSWRDDLITALFSAWLLLGLFIDGWAHNNLDELESFFTPWHAVLYSGFVVTAAWTLWLVVRGMRQRLTGHVAVPVGYGPGLLGVGLFAAGGIADLVWHTVVGIEVSIEALVSPPHLALLTAGILIVTSPLRAAWLSDDPPTSSWPRFLPPLLSLTLAAAAVAFFFQFASAFLSRHATLLDRGGSQIIGILSVLVTNVILMGPLLLMLRRWRPPFGSVTLLFTVVGALMASLHEFAVGITILGAVVGGVAGDVLIRLLHPSPSRLGAYRAVAAAVPLALWAAYFVLLELRFGLAWTPELWGGTVVLAALSGLALSLLMAPSGAVRALEV